MSDREAVKQFIRDHMRIEVSIEPTRGVHHPVRAKLVWNDEVVMTEANKFYAYTGDTM